LFVPASSPDDGVKRYFTLLSKHRFDAAALYWTPRLRAQVPPAEVADQYRDLRSLELVKNSVVAVDQESGIANVLVDARLDVGGQTYDLVGFMYMATGPNGWRVDQIQLKQVSG